MIVAYGINYWFASSDSVIAERMSRLDEEGVGSRTVIWKIVLNRGLLVLSDVRTWASPR